MSFENARILTYILLIIGFLIMLMSYIYEPMFKIGMAVIFPCFIPHFLFNKCPHCRKLLRGNEKFCPRCGGRIDED